MAAPSARSLFVTGTDTGVGKTLVTALLVLRLRGQGVDAGVMKPFATGCRRRGDELLGDDALWLLETTGLDDPLELVNPVRFEEPLAPLVAARRAGEAGRDLLGEALRAYAELSRRHACVIVEGVGGLLVPLQAPPGGRPATCADLAAALGLGVVVVARRTLGTLNHTALTCRVPLRPPASFAGLVLCDAEPVADGDVAASTAGAVLEETTGLEVWGHVPFLRDRSPRALADAAARLLAPRPEASRG